MNSSINLNSETNATSDFPSAIVFQKSWGRIAELRFAETVEAQPTNGLDLVHFLHARRPPQGGSLEKVQTRLIDLSKPEEQLLVEMNNTTRYEIKRAGEKDNLRYSRTLIPSTEEIEKFRLGYDDFARTKSLSSLSKSVYLKYLENRALSISQVIDSENRALTQHSYLRAGNRVRLLHSFSSIFPGLDRNMISRANRWHHWKDILEFKADGAKFYDFGGIYTGLEDQHKLNINKFKEGFGGFIEDGFNASVPVTWKGSAYLFLRRFL